METESEQDIINEKEERERTFSPLDIDQKIDKDKFDFVLLKAGLGY